MTPETVEPWIASVMAPHWKRLGVEYVRSRKAWARTIRLPLHKSAIEPDPATFDGEDPELG